MTRQKRTAGQTATEYMLVISVVVLAVVASAYVFVPEFQGGVSSLASDARQMLASGSINGIGFGRASGGSGNAGTAGRPDDGNGSGGVANDAVGPVSPAIGTANPLGNAQTVSGNGGGANLGAPAHNNAGVGSRPPLGNGGGGNSGA